MRPHCTMRCLRKVTQCPVKPELPPCGPHVRFRRVQTLVREGSPLVKLRNSASKIQSVDQRMRLGTRCRLSPTADVPSHTSGAAMCQTRTFTTLAADDHCVIPGDPPCEGRLGNVPCPLHF